MRLVVEVKALADGGVCVAEVVSGELQGKKIFVPYVVPGEIAEVEISKDKLRYAHARLIEIRQASKERREAPCRLFKLCGGCDYQHMTIDAQRRAKREMIETSIRHHLKVGPDQGVKLIAEDLPEFNYRKRVRLHLSKEGDLGFFKRGSGDIISSDYCYLASDEINKSIRAFGKFSVELREIVDAVVFEEHELGVAVTLSLRGKTPSFEKAMNKLRAISLFEQLPTFALLADSRPVFVQLGGVVRDEKSFMPFGGFSQVNEVANAVLVEEVVKRIRGIAVTEYYAGSGNFTLPLAQQGKKIQAVEVDRNLVALAQKRAADLGLNESISFIQNSCEQYVRNHSSAENVLLDPPRSGAQAVVSSLTVQKTALIVYVSCHLPSLLRDLKILLDGSFKLKEVLVLDMFPQTQYAETISLLGAERR